VQAHLRDAPDSQRSHRPFVLDRDKRIRTRPGEREALIASGVRAFCITGGGNYDRWDALRLLAARWARIEEVAAARAGSYIYSVTWEGVRELSLAGGSVGRKRGNEMRAPAESPTATGLASFARPS
jgi:PIN like domain